MNQKKELDKNSIKNFLLLQLYKEYEHILYSYKIKLKKAFLKIDPINSHYGSWCPKTRAITLSENLIFKYPWGYTLEILKHEMAHQYVAEVYKKNDHHGPYFKKACALLRVKTWAQKACLTLDTCLLEIGQDKKSDKENKSLRLIKKLLGLSHSTNKNESFLALQKASEVAKKHQIDLENLDQEKKFTKLTIPLLRKKVHAYETLIASLLVSHFNVKIIHASLFNEKTLREEKTLEILGDEKSIKMAEYIFFFLTRKLDSLWKEYSSEKNKKGLKLKNSFFFGAIDGFRSELDLSKATNEKSHLSRKEALIIQKHEEKLRNYTNYEFPRTSLTKSNSYSSSSGDYADGFSKGKKIKVREPISKNSNQKRLD